MVGPSPAEEEAVKRNTDCVYFLASPLTCKKGSECEYRHSEIARVNPRDCWFWLHGNCLNLKCGFRHPPLDGLLGAQTPTTTGYSLNPSQNSETPTSQAPNTSSKQAAPCIFFQKGFCLKGDWCPFLHVQNFTGNKAAIVSGIASSAEPATSKTALGVHEKFPFEKKVPPFDRVNSVAVSHKVKMPVAIETAQPKNEFSVSRSSTHSSGVKELLDYSTTNGNPFSWSNSGLQPHPLGETGVMNNKDADEVSREPSPGFDVLVDDERRDSEYYPNEDQYGMGGEHEAGDEYDIDPATDYNMIADIDSERFQNSLGYDSHEIREARHGLERHRASSGRVSAGGYRERMPCARDDSVSRVNELDLRHRLNNRKRTNGLRSVISREHSGEKKIEGRRYTGFHAERHHVSLPEKSLSSQLQGRIRLPVPSEQNLILAPHRGRLSPTRTSSPYQGRIQDRIKGRVGEHFHNGGKIHQVPRLDRDAIGDNDVNFTGPKSLAELKNQKNAPLSRQFEANQQSLGKRKDHLMSDDVSFEGPRPLEEILKRKRNETPGIVRREGIIADNTEKEDDGMTKISKTTTNLVSVASNNKMVNNPDRNNEDVLKPASADTSKDEESGSAAAAVLIPARTIEAEDDEVNVEVDKNGESDYEQVCGENYELYDGENIDADGDGEYMEDDEDDDFAKKMGVMYS